MWKNTNVIALRRAAVLRGPENQCYRTGADYLVKTIDILTANILSPSYENDPFHSAGMHIGGQCSTQALLTLCTVTGIKHAVL